MFTDALTSALQSKSLCNALPYQAAGHRQTAFAGISAL
jgi:hypothetical protein